MTESENKDSGPSNEERIEAWVLQQAGVTFDRASESGKLRVVV